MAETDTVVARLRRIAGEMERLRLDALAVRLDEAGDRSAAFGGREWATEVRAALAQSSPVKGGE